MSKAKAQGTSWETWLVNWFTDRMLIAWRLAEKGSNDEGDIKVITPHAEWHVEAKARANLNVTQALAKAKAKSGNPHTAVIWKRLTRKGDNQRRSPEGESKVVIISLDAFTELISDRTPRPGSTHQS